MNAGPTNVSSNGHARPRPGARRGSEPLESALQASHERRVELLDSALSKIYAGATALREENEQLRAEVAHLHRLVDRLG